jgi:ribosomal-protein-alanine N-acetyltransferase
LRELNQIKIRRAREADLPEILRLEREGFPAPWTDEMYRTEFDRDTAVFLVAERAEKIAGHACAWAVRDEGHILKIAVDGGTRRKGLGRALMDALAGELMKRGVKMMWLEVRESNRTARLFYQRLGFDEIGVRKRYYSDTGEDAVLMMKGMSK